MKMCYWICQVRNCLRKNVSEYGLLEMLGRKLFEEECHEYGLSISRDIYRKAGDCLQLKKEHMGKGKLTTENRRQKEKTMSNYYLVVGQTTSATGRRSRATRQLIELLS